MVLWIVPCAFSKLGMFVLEAQEPKYETHCEPSQNSVAFCILFPFYENSNGDF